MRQVVAGILGVTIALGSARADSDALDDFLGPREIAVGEALRGGATGATGIGLNPAGLPLNRELVFEGGYGYRFDDSASLMNISACDSTNLMPGCFFYQYAGSSPDLPADVEMDASRTTHVGGLSLSRMLVPRILIGATTKYFNTTSSVMGETASKGFAWDVGTTVRITDMINVGVSAQNLFKTADSIQFPRAVGGGLQARPLSSLALSFDMRKRLDGGAEAMRFGGGAELFLRSGGGQTGFPIRLGALRDNNGDGTTYLSAGLGVTSLKWGIDVTGRRMVAGGDETLVIASMRFWGPRMPAPDLAGISE